MATERYPGTVGGGSVHTGTINNPNPATQDVFIPEIWWM